MYLLFDIGGTKTRLAFSEDGKTFEEPEIFLTSDNFEEGMAFIKKTGEKLAKGRKIKALAGGIAGSLDREKKKTLILPHLLGWQGKPLANHLREAFL
ncbi:ROK family protein, partial [Candidatus Azambacteria bacterium]|nr:ROK family protein [Candidatus Azambacteria bacterium]